MQPITLIIPNYNGAHLLRRNLPSVQAAAAGYGSDTQIIVVDDGSNDESIAVLRDEFPAIRCIAHEVNQGFAEAILTGVHHASTDLVFLLNSDVELHAGCLEKLEPYFDFPETFSVCPLIFGEDGSIKRHSWNLRRFNRGHLVIDEWNLPDARRMRESRLLRSLYSSGGSMLVCRKKFLELGGFHPIYKPFYGEDFDLGIRAWYRGWSSYFEPNATLIHQSQGSIKDAHKRKRVKMIRRRNRYFLEWTHTPLPRLIRITLPFSLLQLLGELLMLDFVNLKGFLATLPYIRDVIDARHAAEDGRIQSIDAILQLLYKSPS
jgi:GT2 family glycosyltransferase